MSYDTVNGLRLKVQFLERENLEMKKELTKVVECHEALSKCSGSDPEQLECTKRAKELLSE